MPAATPSVPSDLEALERFIADNDDLLDLEARIGRFNVFDALRIAKAEIRHSNFLAWLLNPSASHGQGDLFLKAVVTDMLRKARAQAKVPALSPIEIDGQDLHAVELQREWRSTDLLVVCRDPKFIIVVENKIDSGEHSNQLQRYQKAAAQDFPGFRHQFVFLTIDGDDPTEEAWVSYSYEDLHSVLSRTRRQAAGSLGADVGVFLDHYLELIGTRFMDNKSIIELCRRIRSNHSRAIDLIIEHTGGESEPLLSEFAKRVEADFPDLVVTRVTGRDVRAVPKAWLTVLPPIGEGDDPRAWLAVRFVTRGDRCWLGVRTSGVTDIARRNIVLRALFDAGAGLDLKPSFKNWEFQQRVMLTQHRVATWGEEDEPDITAIVDRAAEMLPGLLKKLADVPGLITRALSTST